MACLINVRSSLHPPVWLHITFMSSMCGNQQRVHTCNNAVTTTVKSLCIMDDSTAITVARCGRNNGSNVQLLGFHANLMKVAVDEVGRMMKMGCSGFVNVIFNKTLPSSSLTANKYWRHDSKRHES